MSLLPLKSRTSEVFWLVVGLVAFLTLVLVDGGRTFNYPGQPTFWDAHVYERAIHALQSGGNPYVQDARLSFVYPPVVLHLAGLLSRGVHGDLAWKLYLLLTFAAAVGIPVIIAAGYLRSRWFNAGFALLIATFHPFSTLAFSFYSGNIASILYALVLLTGIPGVRKNHWWWFYGAVVLAATIKISMLAFLLLPLLLGARQGLATTAAGFALVAVNAMQRALAPAEYQAYLAAVRHQVLVREEYGFGVSSTLFHLLRRVIDVPQTAVMPGHVLLCTALAGALFWAHKKGVPAELRSWWCALVLLLAVLCTPRVLAYDIAVLVVPTAFLVAESVRACAKSSRGRFLAAGFLLAIVVAFKCNVLDAYCAIATACFPVAGYLWFLRSDDRVRRRRSLPVREISRARRSAEQVAPEQQAQPNWAAPPTHF